MKKPAYYIYTAKSPEKILYFSPKKGSFFQNKNFSSNLVKFANLSKKCPFRKKYLILEKIQNFLRVFISIEA